MEKKQSSVEWLVKNMEPNILWTDKAREIFEQAKAMHKEEIEEAFTRGLITEDVYYGYDDKKEEKYYNETFGGNNE